MKIEVFDPAMCCSTGVCGTSNPALAAFACERVQDLNEPTGYVNVIDKSALTARLARSYLNELKERARIS